MHSHTLACSSRANAVCHWARRICICVCVMGRGVNKNQLIMDIQCKCKWGGGSSGLCNSLKEKVKRRSLVTATVGADKTEILHVK